MLKILFALVKKQATLIKRSIVLSLSLHLVFPVLTVYSIYACYWIFGLKIVSSLVTKNQLDKSLKFFQLKRWFGAENFWTKYHKALATLIYTTEQ